MKLKLVIRPERKECVVGTTVHRCADGNLNVALSWKLREQRIFSCREGPHRTLSKAGFDGIRDAV